MEQDFKLMITALLNCDVTQRRFCDTHRFDVFVLKCHHLSTGLSEASLVRSLLVMGNLAFLTCPNSRISRSCYFRGQNANRENRETRENKVTAKKNWYTVYDNDY